MDEEACKRAKQELRVQVAQNVAQLEVEYMAKSDAAIAEHVLSLPEYQRAGTVFCFVSTGREVETRPILRDALRSGKRVGVPLCVAKGIMEIRAIDSLERLIPGKYGIMEPEAGCPLIAADDVDFALIPCASCDRQGRRLGFGGGYYDRYLEHASFSSAVVCREQTLCAEVPVAPHDIPMRLIVTENGVLRL